MLSNLLNHTKEMLVDAVKAYIDTKKSKLPDEDASIVNDEFVAAYGANAAIPLPEHILPTSIPSTHESSPAAEASPTITATPLVADVPIDIPVQAAATKPPLRSKVSKLNSEIADDDQEKCVKRDGIRRLYRWNNFIRKKIFSKTHSVCRQSERREARRCETTCGRSSVAFGEN